MTRVSQKFVVVGRGGSRIFSREGRGVEKPGQKTGFWALLEKFEPKFAFFGAAPLKVLYQLAPKAPLEKF